MPYPLPWIARANIWPRRPNEWFDLVGSTGMKDLQSNNGRTQPYWTSLFFRWRQEAVWLLPMLVLLSGNLTLHAQTSMSEYPLKALFLLNFAKYVDWSSATSGAKGPFVIDILGQDNFGGSLQKDVEGKSIDGREIIIKYISSADQANGCAILFVSASESSHLNEILGKTSALPILTVGEDQSFLQRGGIINFVLKDGKIHLGINLKAARQVKLQISSKLLSVADNVME
jgi:hypothetical protein